MTDEHIYRQQLLDFFNAGVHAVKGDTAVSRYLQNVELPNNCYAVAVGKAASAMLRGALNSAPEKIQKSLLITKHGHVDDELKNSAASIEIVESSHPVPGEDSLHAGHRLLAFLQAAPADAHLLFLISGGTSSLLEVLPEGMTLDDLQSLNDTLLASGFDIGTMNRVRKSVSCVKGGRLAGFIGERQVTCLLVSDVPGDRIADIGSGLLCREEASVIDNLPEQLARFVQPSSSESVDAATWSNIETHLVASLSHAKSAAADAASAAGYTVSVDDSFTEGSASIAGIQIATALKSATPGVHIWGGETTMILPENPGRGGRNQHLALAAASILDGSNDCYLLCAGTDGSDGPTHDAGGLVDGDTVTRGDKKGLDLHASMHAADSGSFLEAAGALVTTGPTGTNVMDLAIGLKVVS